jgi:hypothetical protein
MKSFPGFKFWIHISITFWQRPLFLCFSKTCSHQEWCLHKDDKIVLVGHSFGGLLIKSLTVEASKHASSSCEMCQTFLEHIKGIIFYAVPHSGRLTAQYAQNFDKAFPHRLPGVMRGLKEFEDEMEQLSNNFNEKILKLSSDPDHATHGITIYFFAEREKYNKVRSPTYFISVVVADFSSQECEWRLVLFFLKVLVVPLASVTKFPGHSMIVRANHVDICKPATKGDPGYQKLLEILGTILVPDSNYHISTSAGGTAAKSSIKSENLSGTIPQSPFYQLSHYISKKQHRVYDIVHSFSKLLD